MNIESFKQRLLAKESELMADIERFKSEARVAGEAEVRDSMDAASISQATAESLQEETLASRTLAQVRDALRRIEDGVFGKCIACGRQIDPARLEAIPWTPYCLDDQKKQDKAAGVRGGPTL